MIVYGKVIQGFQDGKKLGFPTINLNLDQILNIKQGIYLCKIFLHDQIYYGVLHYAPRYIFNEEIVKFEVHIFDFNQQIYGEIVGIEILNFIRESRNFDSIEELKKEIINDIQKAKKIIKNQINNK